MSAPARRRPARRSVAFLALASAAGAACGRPALLDTEQVEARIAESIEERYEVEVDDVVCPDDVAVEEGAAFACTVGVDDGEVDVDVEQVDGDGALAVSPRQAVLVVERVVADAAAALADRFSRQVEVSCPGGPVRIEEPGATFRCTAVDGPQEVTVEVRVRDAHGALTYALL